MGFLKVVEICLDILFAFVILSMICESANKKSNLKALITIADLKNYYIKDGLLHDKANITSQTSDILLSMFAMLGSAVVLIFDNKLVIFGIIVAAFTVLQLLYNLMAHLCGFNTYTDHLIVKAMKDRTHKSVNKALTVDNIEISALLLYIIAIIVGLFM